jgi:AAA domain
VDLVYNQIFTALEAIVPRGSVFEIRCIGDRKGRIDSGYFDSTAEAASVVCASGEYYKGMYVTPNPVSPETLARSYNRITQWSQFTTYDSEVTRRKWLLIDIDPKRPKGISSSDVEHQAALAKGVTIAGVLSVLHGFCEPMLNSSGNGCHLMYPMDEENSIEVRDELHTFLKTIKMLYDDDQCEIDITVFNAARIWRLPGTWARKGDSIPTRPHRRAQILKPIQHLNKLSIVQVLRVNQNYSGQLKLRTGSSTVGDTRKNAKEYPDDEAIYKRLNVAAYSRVREWVPHFFPTAREYKEGYRVPSEDLGLEYEEELTIHPLPYGIKYFGTADQGDKTEGRRTPIGVIAEFGLRSTKAAAAQALADILNLPLNEFTALDMPAPTSGGATVEALMGVKPAYSFKGIRSISDLQAMAFKEIKYVVKGVIPTGNMMLAARPKMRKTWLALQLCMAIASGRKFLDWECNKGDVLFLGLEDNERRMQNRIRTLQKFEMFPPDLSGFRYWTGGMDYDSAGKLRVTNPEEQAATMAAFPRGEAGTDALEQYLEQYPLTSTIIIDTLAHFRGERTSRDVYQSDYESMMPLTKLAARKNVLIIPVHHEKKGLADRGAGADFLEDVSGSAGITGGCDGVISIKGRRGVQEENESRKLHISGRDVEFDYEIDISFDAETGGWRKAIKEDAKVALREALARHPFLNQKDMQAILPNVSLSRMLKCLLEMKLEGEIEQGRYGYSLKRG